MHIRQLDPDRPRDIRQWIAFPHSLYRQNQQWVPSMESDERLCLDTSRHPFYEHSVAAFFVAEGDDGETLGRIAVMENRNANTYRGTMTAFFGRFEVVEDSEVSRLLFSAAETWARERGLVEMLGPRGFIGSDGSGVLIEGFDHRPAMGVPYNHPYYARLYENAGYEKDTDHFSGYVRGDHVLPERVHTIAERIKARRGFQIVNFNTGDEIRAWVPKVKKVHRQAFEGSHTFYPPTETEMTMIADQLIGVADPGLIKLILNREDDVIGFIFAYHDIGAGLQKSKGRVWPFGWWHLMQERKRTKWVNINGIGLLPDYQGLGGNAILYTELQKTIRAYGFEHIDVVQVDEKNLKSYRDMVALGVEWYKKHRHYKKDIT